jgi:muconate cycloisomerase
VDANGVWNAEQAVRMAVRLEPLGVSCVEQPLPLGQEAELPELRRRSPIPIMLDESLNSLDSARQAVAEGQCDIFNIRISKLGGFVASLRAALIAREAGLAYALGCQVGETAILSAAGRHFASALGDLRYLEGSYDRFLLARNVTRRPVSFGWGGFARAIAGPGLGIQVDRRALDALTEEVREIEL